MRIACHSNCKAADGQALHITGYEVSVAHVSQLLTLDHVSSDAAGYTGYQYMQGLPFMRKANAKRAKQVKQRRAAQPVRDDNPEEWLKGTNFAKVRQP